MATAEFGPGSLQALKKDLKDQNLRNLYFFYGEESFLLHYYLEAIKKQLVDELTESFNYHRLTSENFTVQVFADAVENLPMMAEHTFIWVDDIDIFKLSDTDRQKMSEILSDIPEYCTVVFTYIVVEWKPDKRYKKLYDAVVNHGTEIPFDRQDHRDLITWITRHFAAEKKQITPDLCSYLIDITGGTMTVLAGEISKICAYSDSDHIVKADIDAVTEPVVDAVVFQMTNFLGQGNYGAALVKLRELLKMQEVPLMILGTIGNHFRRLSAARMLLDNGGSPSELMRMFRMGDYAARKLMSTAAGFSARFCEAAMELVIETDNQFKSSYTAPERLLEILVLRLAQEARNG